MPNQERVPSEIWNLTQLEFLGLSLNYLSGEISSEIGNLINVNYFYLNDNQLTGEIPFEICNIGDPIPSLFNNKLCPPYPDCISQSNIDSFDTSECEECLSGDTNEDEIINVLDVISTTNCIIDDDNCNDCSDMNNDGIINVQDIVILVSIILDN